MASDDCGGSLDSRKYFKAMRHVHSIATFKDTLLGQFQARSRFVLFFVCFVLFVVMLLLVPFLSHLRILKFFFLPPIFSVLVLVCKLFLCKQQDAQNFLDCQWKEERTGGLEKARIRMLRKVGVSRHCEK